MKIKRYFAADMRQAIRMVREAQGPDAVILSNRRVDGGVEIVAAVDYDALLTDLGVTPPADQGARKPAGAPAPIDTGRATPAEEPALRGMTRELSTLRNMLEHQLSGLAWGELGRRHPQRMLLIRRLRELGIGAQVAQEVAAGVAEHAEFERSWREALALLAHRLPVTNDDILINGGVVALIGPTGVGKTTTVAKLAARFILRHGPRSVALVTTDDQRIGAHEQLRIYGKILDIPVRVARDHRELRATLDELAGHKLVLIDTAGMSQRDARLIEQLRLIRSGASAVRSYLVLAATAQMAAIDEVVRAFRGVELSGCILTKIDETTSLGGALSVVCRHRLPIAYTSDGQRVPEDLRPARAHTLVSRCVSITQAAGGAHAGKSKTYKKVALHA